jgi:hypothetical protein
VPLAVRTGVIDQTLAMALHPVYDCSTAKFCVETILNLTQSPETHPYITRREVVEKMLEICEQRHKTLDQLSPLFQQTKKTDPMEINVLKYVAAPSLPSSPQSLTHIQYAFTLTQALY